MSTPRVVRADARDMACFLSALLLVALMAISFASLTSRAEAARHSPYTHAPDYSWVAGRIERSELEGGFWTIRYQKPGEKADAYGGHFVLHVTPAQGAALHAEAMVLVTGHVERNAVDIQMAGTAYRVRKIEPLNRP